MKLKLYKMVFVSLCIIFLNKISFSQIVVTDPQYPTQNDSIIVYFDTTQPGAEELLNYAGTVCSFRR